MHIGEDSFIDWSSTPYWARIHFVENDGMAFGIRIWGPYGKLILSIFRIIAVGALIYFIRKLLEAKATLGLLISFSLILAGAIGNILDSAFYGLIFSAYSPHSGNVAELFPEAGGYAGFLHGYVVDMLHFPMMEGYFPDWFPFWGGQSYVFFRPVFNIADVSISVGVISILLFQRSFFSSDTTQKVKDPMVENEKPETNTVEDEKKLIENEAANLEKSDVKIDDLSNDKNADAT